MAKKADTMTPCLLTINRFCEEVGISESYFHKLCKEGRGPKKTRLSKKGVRITRENMNVWLKELTKEGEV